jgi:signal transduction histidine kinase/ActR/RegA family two-component response regulator
MLCVDVVGLARHDVDLSHTMRRSLALLALFVAYLAAAKLGLSLAFVHPSATPVWPPTGIAIAAVLLLGRPARPIIFLAAFLINAITAGTVITATGIGIGNVLEAVAGAYFIERWANGRRMLDRAPSIFRFVALMAPTAAISATIGVTILSIAGQAPWSHYVSIWLTWWMGDLSGGLLIVPLVLAWTERRVKMRADVTLIEIAMLFGLVSLSAAVTFGGFGPWPNHEPLAFLTIPPLAWAAFRFGLRYASLAIAVMSTIATWSTVRGSGPFAVSSENTALLVLATFIATLTATMLPMAAVVTERRRAEDERARLLAREHTARVNAEATSSAKDDFLAMLGLELRNPLSAIATAAHVLSLDQNRDESANHAQRVINRQVKHLARLVDDLLDVTRVTTGKVTLAREPVDISALVLRSVDSLELSSRESDRQPGPQLQLEIGSALWVRGDPTRLEQIVTNLLTNAVKYTPATGTVRVVAAADGDRVVIRVVDTGIGIDPGLLPHIFERFIQADTGPARSHGGLGLGLTLVKHFVELHGGRVSATSEGTGLGSAFTVSLPAAPAASRPGAPPAAAGTTKRRVLLVEDQVDAREMMRFALEIAGHQVTEVDDGPSAVAAVAEINPDVAFVDIGLPGFNGYEVARQVRAMRGNAIVLVALTGYGQPSDRAESESAGFDHHLVKPVDLEKVIELLDALPHIAPAARA